MAYRPEYSSAPVFTIIAKLIVLHPLESTDQLRLRDILQVMWSKACSTSAHIVGDGIFKICFASEVARDLALQNQPWFVNNNLLAMTRGDVVPMCMAERDLELTPFWIRMDEIPPAWDCERGFHQLIPRLSQVFRHIPIYDFYTMHRGFLRFKVIINTSLPLPIGIDILENVGPSKWSTFQYEKLKDFCYSCGRLGHRDYRCPYEPKTILEEAHRNYGEHMKTGAVVPLPDLFITGRRLSWSQRIASSSSFAP